MWKTNIENADLKFGTRSILSEALEVLEKALGKRLGVLSVSDRVGRIGYEVGSAYLVAKKAPYGDIVSVHRTIWQKAKRRGWPIIMYIQSAGYFYRFNPLDIKTTTVNLRGTTPMINFSIKEGRNIMQTPEEVERIKNIVAKNIRKPLTIEELAKSGTFG